MLFTYLYQWGEEGDFREQAKEMGLAFIVIGKQGHGEGSHVQAGTFVGRFSHQQERREHPGLFISWSRCGAEGKDVGGSLEAVSS